MIRFEVDTVFAVRPRKGERRHKGMLLKTSISAYDTLSEAKSAAKAATSREIDGYSKCIAFRAYDYDTFAADPINAKPVWTA